MSEIVKTEAIVLSKLNYGDTSSIVSLYTETDGRISAIVKGGRSPKSKSGKIIDPLNHLQVIFYKKNTRDVQILSEANLISYFVYLKEDLDATKYGLAVIEIIKNLTAEHEENPKLFKGVIRILQLMDKKKEAPSILFGRFLLFFLSELGYEISLDKCNACGKGIRSGKNIGFDFNTGFICSDCFESHSGLEKVSTELFEILFCLKTNRKIELFSVDLVEKVILLLERYLKFHITDYKGIQSLNIYK